MRHLNQVQETSKSWSRNAQWLTYAYRAPASSWGTVDAALETPNGDVFVGVCVDTSRSLGFCAEHAAAAAMLTAGREHRRADGRCRPTRAGTRPCGRCRAFISQLSDANLKTEVLVADNVHVLLRELMPYRWPCD